jgi:hypothetical protein
MKIVLRRWKIIGITDSRSGYIVMMTIKFQGIVSLCRLRRLVGFEVVRCAVRHRRRRRRRVAARKYSLESRIDSILT